MLIDIGESSLFADCKVFYFEVDNLKPSETNMTEFIDFEKPKNLDDFDKLIVTGLFESTLILINLCHSHVNYFLTYERSYLKFLQNIDISDLLGKDEETQFDFTILPEIEKIIFYRVNEIFLFAVVDLQNSHLIQLLESPIQALLEAPVNNFSLVGTFSSYNEELTVVSDIVSGEDAI